MEQFGKYELIRRIGSGGMAEVFLARTTVAQNLAKHLVIKKIHPAFARSRQFMSMFVDEAKIALGLNHPNIVQVFDFGAVGETFFLAMEYVEGVDLLRLMQEASRQNKRLPLGVSAYLVQQVAKGLDYAHRKADEYGQALGIVHRDISPQNILVSWDGAVKIVDFGIARARDIHEEEGVVKGKFAYMSPEQARGEMVDRRADVFSAGVVLFELACGRPLFPGKGKEVLDKVKAGAIPRPRDLNKDITPSLEQVIVKAVSFHRDDRFQTGRDLQHALGRFQYELAESADAIVDSAVLAKVVSQTVPERRKRQTVRPPTAPVPREVLAAAKGLEEQSRSIDLSRGLNRPARKKHVRERKNVLVLEGQISGVESLERKVGRANARRVVADFLNMARDIAFKHEALVDTVGRSGFGFVVGLPVSSEDDATRTLRLALALVDALDGIGHDVEPELRLAVGIQRGVAVVTRKESAPFEYELGAQTTHIARLLAAEAHGADVLCGGAVYRVSRAEWNFEEMTTIEIPDDSQPDAEDAGAVRATVYRLRGPKERRQRLKERSKVDSDLIGRDLELKALRDAYKDARVNERLRVVALVGEAGMGKRSLVGALLESIPDDEATVLRAAARASASYIPFGIIADLARDLMGLAEGADPREIRRRLEAAAELIYSGKDTDGDTEGLIDAMGALLGAHGTSPAAGDADERRQRIVEAMMRVEQRYASDKPLVVVCEDLQWADDQSLELFRDVLQMENSRGLLAIVTARPESRVKSVVDSAGGDTVKLEELDKEHRVELVTRRFVPGEDVADLARQLVDRAGGNPFFLNEMLDALVDRGILVAETTGEHTGRLRYKKRDAPIQVPTSIEALLSTRIDRLPQRSRQTLLHAAVLGRRFGKGLLEGLLGGPAGDALDALVDRGFLYVEGAVYSFVNELMLTVAYRMLPNEERMALHERAAETIEQSPGYRQLQDDAMIARHLELAGRGSDAADRYLSAAAHAVDVGGNSDAFRQLTRALRLLPEDAHERRFVARQKREEILRRLARRPQQLREIEGLKREAEQLGDPAKIALAYSCLAQFYLDVGKSEAAAQAVAPALENARKANSDLAQAEALRIHSSLERLAGRSERALEITDEALALCDEGRDGLFQRAKILNNRGTTLWNMSRLSESIEAYAEALVIYRALKLPRLEARSLNNMGVVFSAMGEVEEALAHYKSSLKLDQRLGDRANIALKLGNIGQTYSDLGDMARGERYLSKALAITEQNEDRNSRIDVLISLGQVELNRRDYFRAIERFEEGLALAEESQNRYQEIRGLIYLALAHVEAGDDAEAARVLAARATELARQMPMPVGEIYGLAVQGMALGELDRADEGAQLTAKAVELQGATEQPEGYEQILYIHATLCEKAGRLDEAREAAAMGHAEVERKASKLTDERLRKCYLSAKTPSEIAKRHERLTK